MSESPKVCEDTQGLFVNVLMRLMLSEAELLSSDYWQNQENPVFP